MPYILPERREEIDQEILDMGVCWTPQNAGDMNFLISEFINGYFKEKGLNYANLNEMIGMLECAKLELYRVLGAPYEDKKAEENSPVYGSIEAYGGSNY